MALSLAQHSLFSTEALEGHHLHFVRDPALDKLPLRAGQHSSHFEHVARTMPLQIGTVEAAEPQPYHSALFVERELPPLDDPRIDGAFPGILAQFLHLLLHVVGLKE
jgi:hypothetical protein